MGTFMCHQGCTRYCKTAFSKALAMDLAYYPGLTAAERALIAEYPKEAQKVYAQMNIAENLTMKNFNRSTQKDESDAFRHFVWASLMSKEIGSDLAEKFLDAHEATARHGTEDTAMDLANNRAGLLESERLRKSGNLTETKIEEKGLEALKFNKMVVLVKKGAPK